MYVKSIFKAGLVVGCLCAVIGIVRVKVACILIGAMCMLANAVALKKSK